MTKSIVEMTQFLLDRSQPGFEAQTVLADWDLDLLRNTRSDVKLLASLLYDGYKQGDFRTSDDAQNGYINKSNFLMEELLYRYVSKVLGPAFVERSRQIFAQAHELVVLNKQVKYTLSNFERKPGFDALRKGADAEVEALSALVDDVYLLGEARATLKSGAGLQIRELYFPTKVSAVPDLEGEAHHTKKQWKPLKIPMLEEIGRKMDEAHERIDLMSDQELATRLLRSFSTTRVAEYKTDYPVYGVKTMYAYIPLVIDRLVNGWSFDNEAVMDDLAVSMDDAKTRLVTLHQRLKRMIDADNARKIEYLSSRYGDGECAIFAVALHQITTLPVMVFNVSAETGDPGLPLGFPRHAAVQVKPDVFLDACGTFTLAEANKRFGCELVAKADPKLSTSFFEPSWSKSAYSDEDIITTRDHANQLLTLRKLRSLVDGDALERLDRYTELGM